MTDKTVTLSREPVAWANWKVGTKSYVPYRTLEEAQASVSSSEIAATQLGPYKVVPLYAALAEPVPPAGGEPEVLGWVVTDMNGDFYFAANRQTPGDVALVDRALVTRLQAEVRLLKHDVAYYLETAAKTCDLLGIDLEAAKTAEGKPSDVLYRHAMALQAELTRAREELDTLRHAVWHALDDSEENAQTGEVTLSRYDFDELSTLVPEEWHDAYHNQSAPAAKGDGLSGTFSISPQQQEAQITVTDLRGVAPWEPAPVAVVPDLTELREHHAHMAVFLQQFEHDPEILEVCRKRAEFHRRQVALLDSLNN